MGLSMEKMEAYQQIQVSSFRIKLDKNYFDGFLRWFFVRLLKNFGRFGRFFTFTDIILPVLQKRRICDFDYKLVNVFLTLYNTLPGERILGRTAIICIFPVLQ